MTTAGTSEDTGAQGPSVEDAAARIVGLLSVDGDSEDGETQEAEASEEVDEFEAEADDEDAEQSDEDETDDSDVQALSDDTPITLQVDGADVEVTLHELKRGFLRESDYTRKTMALSEDRKALETEKATTAQTREQYADAVQRLEAFLSGGLDDEDLSELRHSDPAEYAARLADRQIRAQQLEAAKAERQRLADEQSEEEAAQRQQHLAGEREKLLKVLPHWTDEAKARKDSETIAKYGAKLGLSSQELGTISDHRLVKAMLDAACWDALQAKKPAVQAKVETAKTVKPGAAKAASNVSDATRAKQRLAKTGSMQDAAAALMHIL